MIMEQILEETLDGLKGFKNDLSPDLCLKHKQEKADAKKRKRLKDLLEYDASKEPKSERAKSILEGIDQDVIKAKAELERIAKNFETNVIVTGLVQDMLTKAAALRFVQPCMECYMCKLECNSYKELLDKKLNEEATAGNALNFGLQGSASKQYFKAPSAISPYEFDFDLIFANNEPDEGCDPIKDALKKAMNTDGSPIVAADKVFVEMWQSELLKWKERQTNKDSRDSMSCGNSYSDYSEEDDFFKIENSQRSIRKALKQVFSRMAKDPYFMLASLPDAHKLPIFEAWVRNRYNLKKSEKARRRILLQNEYKLMDLVPAWICTRPPSNGIVFPWAATLNYDNHDRLHQRKDLMKGDHEKCLKQNLINVNRLLWAAFEAKLCAPRLRDIFYAYNPGAEREFHPKRPWYTHERQNGALPV